MTINQEKKCWSSVVTVRATGRPFARLTDVLLVIISIRKWTWNSVAGVYVKSVILRQWLWTFLSSVMMVLNRLLGVVNRNVSILGINVFNRQYYSFSLPVYIYFHSCKYRMFHDVWIYMDVLWHLWCGKLYSGFDANMTLQLLMVHIKVPAVASDVCRAVAPAFVTWRRSIRCRGVCRRLLIATFKSASVATRLPAICFLRDPNRRNHWTPHTVNRTCDSLRCCGWEVMDHTHHKTDLAPTDIHLFWAPFGKRLATNADVNQAVWRYFFYSGMKAPLPRWDKCWMSMAKTQRSDVRHLLLLGHTQYIEVRIKLSTSECYLIF